MSTSLELLVRPFAARDVTPPPAAVGDAAPAPEPVALVIEGAGVKTFRYSYSESVQGGEATGWKEVKRTSETKRIVNPDDESQFVEIKRAKTITLANEGAPSQRRRYAFKYPDDKST